MAAQWQLHAHHYAINQRQCQPIFGTDHSCCHKSHKIKSCSPVVHAQSSRRCCFGGRNGSVIAFLPVHCKIHWGCAQSTRLPGTLCSHACSLAVWLHALGAWQHDCCQLFHMEQLGGKAATLLRHAAHAPKLRSSSACWRLPHAIAARLPRLWRQPPQLLTPRQLCIRHSSPSSWTCQPVTSRKSCCASGTA